MSYDELARIASEVAAAEKIERVDPVVMRELLLDAELTISNRGIGGLPSPDVLPFQLVYLTLTKLRESHR